MRDHPHRHQHRPVGLVTRLWHQPRDARAGLAGVHDELELRFEAAADWLSTSLATMPEEASLLQLPKSVAFSGAELPTVLPLLAGKHIAIARDEAFSFIYDANLKVLSALGASYSFFSTLYDKQLPEADALWLPGG